MKETLQKIEENVKNGHSQLNHREKLLFAAVRELADQNRVAALNIYMKVCLIFTNSIKKHEISEFLHNYFYQTHLCVFFKK